MMYRSPYKLFDMLPDDVTDETAYVLYQFVEDMQVLIEAYYSPKIRRYLLEKRLEGIDDELELEDPPF